MHSTLDRLSDKQSHKRYVLLQYKLPRHFGTAVGSCHVSRSERTVMGGHTGYLPMTVVVDGTRLRWSDVPPAAQRGPSLAETFWKIDNSPAESGWPAHHHLASRPLSLPHKGGHGVAWCWE
jgi:hypothetical protein